MTTSLIPAHVAPPSLTSAQFLTLADVPPEIEWFANLTTLLLDSGGVAFEDDVY